MSEPEKFSWSVPLTSFGDSVRNVSHHRPLVLGIDLGTTRFKALLVDNCGRVVGQAGADLKIEPDTRTYELPISVFWRLVSDCVRHAVHAADASGADIAALAYASQANSFLLLDRENRPLTPLILWPDRRGSVLMPQLRGLTGRPDFMDVTGIGFDTPEFCIAKLLWFQQYCPALWSRMHRIQTISDYFVSELTGEFTGDEGTASLLGLWNLQRHEWWDTALQHIGITHDHLSLPQAPAVLAGRVHPRGATLLDIRPNLPLAVGSLDHHVAAIGAGVRRQDEFSFSLGTVTACLQYSDEYSPLPGCCMGPGVQGHKYYRLTFDANGAGPLEWYRREYAPSRTLAEITELAASVPQGCDDLMARPAAHLCPVRGGFLNASPVHTQGHFARALMESTAASLDCLLHRFCSERKPSALIATGGGARNHLWLKLIADMTGIPVVAPDCREPGCRGAAMIAAVAAGWYAGLSEVAQAWPTTAEKNDPNPDNYEYYRKWLVRYSQLIG